MVDCHDSSILEPFETGQRNGKITPYQRLERVPSTEARGVGVTQEYVRGRVGMLETNLAVLPLGPKAIGPVSSVLDMSPDRVPSRPLLRARARCQKHCT